MTEMSQDEWRVVEAVAEELCRQRGWAWKDQGNDVRVALTSAAIELLRVAREAAP